MTRSARVFFLLAPLFLVPICAPAAQARSPDTTAQAVDRLFDDWRGTDTPGCAVGVSRSGQTVLERAYGMANLETGTPIGAGTVFHAGSIAKQFTAMAIMLLVRDRKLGLDDDIRKFIPELPQYGAPITVRHLLTHTSGLRDFFELLSFARGRFEEDRITRADMLDIVTRQKALNFQPGAEYVYSNTGYALLAIIVQRVSGQSLKDFAAARIFAPLGMSHTQFRDDFTALVSGRAFGYAGGGSTWRASAPNYDVNGPTNLLTTAGDLLTWADNFARPRVGDSAIVRQMTTGALLSNGDSTGYGFGVSLVQDRGAAIEEHEGSDPGFGSYLGRYPKYGLAIAVLCNTRSFNPVALGHQIGAIYLDTILAPPAPYPLAGPRAADTMAGATRVGVYYQPTRHEVVELSWRNGALYTARQDGRKLIPLDERRFQVEGLPVLHTFGPAAQSGYVATALLPGHHPVVFEWRAPFVFTPSALAAYVGKYFSEELNATYSVSVSDSTLVLRTGTSKGITARPVFGDTFVSGQVTIEFDRVNGKITGFRITHPRARNIGFARVGQR